MKTSFTVITSVWLSSFLVFSAVEVEAFQSDLPAQTSNLSAYDLMEAGLANEKNVPASIYFLAQGNYVKALEAEQAHPSGWLHDYLKGLNEVFPPLVKQESEHFVVWTPADQIFLARYVIPSLEKTASHIEKIFGHRPQQKIRVEIYPTKEAFSAASTLSLETLERSGAIGICKFHRLMILSPQALPLGYRWLDALSHEYLHLTINELICWLDFWYQ